MDIFGEHIDPSKDLKKERHLVLDSRDENDFVITQEDDMYGLWRIKRQKGKIPESLDGKYTSFLLAQRAVETYLRTAFYNKKIKEVK